MCGPRVRPIVWRSHTHTELRDKYTASQVYGIREAAKSGANELGYRDLKPELLDIKETFVKGCNVFAVHPTGYGKSFCFGCLPSVFDKLPGRVGEERSIIAVVSHLPAAFMWSVFGVYSSITLFIECYATLLTFLHSSGTKLGIDLQPEPHANALGNYSGANKDTEVTEHYAHT